MHLCAHCVCTCVCVYVHVCVLVCTVWVMIFKHICRNLRRTAEVWLDEYKHMFYDVNPAALQIDFGE